MFPADTRAAVAAIDSLTEWMHLGLDLASVLVIATGGVQAALGLPAAIRGRRRFSAVRLDFARYLALALEFQLASDVLQTAISPTWDQLGILAAIATIRTALNFFLSREMEDERSLVGTRRSAGTISAEPVSGQRSAAGKKG
ncbi:MAG TPA: DUF1622 domain-containing protein [Gemmatimonadaceae bacterium]|nr:DUF1622 domain-containing protein [Gemmatimonadaceae bacterium]